MEEIFDCAAAVPANKKSHPKNMKGFCFHVRYKDVIGCSAVAEPVFRLISYSLQQVPDRCQQTVIAEARFVHKDDTAIVIIICPHLVRF